MVPNIVRLLAGLSVSEVVTTRLGLIIILSGHKWVIMTGCDLALRGIRKILSCGNYICIQIPLLTLKTCWKAQIFVISLPYRCIERLLSALRSSISSLADPPIRAVTHQVLQEFLSKRNFLQSDSLSISRAIRPIDEESHRRRNLPENERTKSKEGISLPKEEKTLLRMTVSALKHLRRLKGSRVILDEQFKQTLGELISISRSLFQMEELDELKEGNTRELTKENLKSTHPRFQNQNDLLKDSAQKSKEGYNTRSSRFTSSNEFIATPLKQSSITDSELVRVSMDALQSVVYVLNAENFALKRRLKFTNDQLGGVKTTSKCLANKVTELEGHLDKVKGMLKTTEEERDEMCFKLFALSDIIEEQEMFLNDSSVTDHVSGFHSTLDYLFGKFDGAAEVDSDCELFGQESPSTGLFCPKPGCIQKLVF